MNHFQKSSAGRKSVHFSKASLDAIREATKGKHRVNAKYSEFVIDALDRVSEKYFTTHAPKDTIDRIAAAIIDTYFYLTADEVEVAFNLTIFKREIPSPSYTPQSLTIGYCMDVLKEYAAASYCIKNPNKQTGKECVNSGEDKLKLLLLFCETYKKLPATVDPAIIDYLIESRTIGDIPGWAELRWAEKAHKSEEIILRYITDFKPDIPLYDINTMNVPAGNFEGLGTRLMRRFNQQ